MQLLWLSRSCQLSLPTLPADPLGCSAGTVDMFYEWCFVCFSVIKPCQTTAGRPGHKVFWLHPQEIMVSAVQIKVFHSCLFCPCLWVAVFLSTHLPIHLCASLLCTLSSDKHFWGICIKYHFSIESIPQKKKSPTKNKGKCVSACMQNRAIVGGNCVCLHTKQSYYRVGVVFSFYVAKENAFPSESKCSARVIFHWTLTRIIPLVQCLLLATGRVECKHRSLSHLRSRKGQHSHFTPDSLDWDLPQTCLPGMTFMLHKKSS